MTKKQMCETILEAMRFAWLKGDVFKDVTEYMDCVRQVKERFND